MESEFAQTVSCLYRDMQRIKRWEMGRYDLKAIHGDCLLTLLRYPEGITSARLGELCDKDKGAVSRAVADLETRGLVFRDKRYRAPLHLTEAGREAAQAVSDRTSLAFQQAGSGLSEEKQRIFYEAAALLAGNLHIICKEEFT